MATQKGSLQAYSQYTPQPRAEHCPRTCRPESSHNNWLVVTLAASCGQYGLDTTALSHWSRSLLVQGLYSCGGPELLPFSSTLLWEASSWKVQGWWALHLTLPGHRPSPLPSSLHLSPEAEAGCTLHLLHPLSLSSLFQCTQTRIQWSWSCHEGQGHTDGTFQGCAQFGFCIGDLVPGAWYPGP